MANRKHVEIIRQDVSVWNKWREDNQDILPDLSRANLSNANLDSANFEQANLLGTNLKESTLCNANLKEAKLEGANLVSSDLSNADLRSANLRFAKLWAANLTNSNLQFSNLQTTKFQNAMLKAVNLQGAELRNSKFDKTDFEEVVLGETVFANVDLSKVKNLELCIHTSPSTIDHRTLVKSDALPAAFLRGVGLPENYIEYIPSLFWAADAIKFYSCFISYSHKDEEFAKRLHADLQSYGVRCWFAPEDIKIGDRIRPIVDESIRVYDKLLIILSKISVQSTWVEHEAEAAFDKEAEQKKIALFPIRLDDAIMICKAGWAAKIRRERHIGDFRDWKNHDSYQGSLERLLRDLEAEDMNKCDLT